MYALSVTYLDIRICSSANLNGIYQCQLNRDRSYVNFFSSIFRNNTMVKKEAKSDFILINYVVVCSRFSSRFEFKVVHYIVR